MVATQTERQKRAISRCFVSHFLNEFIYIITIFPKKSIGKIKIAARFSSLWKASDAFFHFCFPYNESFVYGATRTKEINNIDASVDV